VQDGGARLNHYRGVGHGPHQGQRRSAAEPFPDALLADAGHHRDKQRLPLPQGRGQLPAYLAGELRLDTQDHEVGVTCGLGVVPRSPHPEAGSQGVELGPVGITHDQPLGIVPVGYKTGDETGGHVTATDKGDRLF